jgi:hypothetical protein
VEADAGGASPERRPRSPLSTGPFDELRDLSRAQ